MEKPLELRYISHRYRLSQRVVGACHRHRLSQRALGAHHRYRLSHRAVGADHRSTQALSLHYA
jgi:hypothetical protein